MSLNKFFKTAVPYAALAGGTFLNLFSTMQEGSETARAGSFNAASLRDRANQTREGGKISLMQFDRLSKKLKGTQRNIASAQGGLVGSSLDAMADAAIQLQLDRQNIQRQTALEARGYEAQANESERAGRAGRQQSYLRAGGTLLEGASRLLQMI